MSFSVISESSIRRRDSLDDLSYSDIEVIEHDINMKMRVEHEAANSPTTPEEPGLTSGSATVLERDPIYFCEIVMLQVEDRVFSVPKSGLIEHGTHFQTLLETCKTGVGSSESNPIVLEGVSKIHFHNFLRLIYPFRGVDIPSGDEHWLGILDLATKWGFNDIRAIALTSLEHLFIPTPPHPSAYAKAICGLHLCQKYNIHKHLQAQYEILVTSIAPLNRNALLAGGIDEETIVAVMEMREKWLCGMLWGQALTPGVGIDVGDDDDSGGLTLPLRLSAKKIVGDYFRTRVGSSSLTVEEVDAEVAVRELEEKWVNEIVEHLKKVKEEKRRARAKEEKRRKEEDRKRKEEEKALERKARKARIAELQEEEDQERERREREEEEERRRLYEEEEEMKKRLEEEEAAIVAAAIEAARIADEAETQRVAAQEEAQRVPFPPFLHSPILYTF
ncbi:hypothetical protein CVT24_008136 [Panaeolus cyanescens]|uniref:BTB domain-containing protein n=1 Tax=Panaeolus cyanescens TaxID=181874 RepID=A0A409W4H2_9AGAR|nr:hypothetical protein CVT24_008136 [Panaeolus cyanescens]